MKFRFYNNTEHDIQLTNSNTNNAEDLTNNISKRYPPSPNIYVFNSNSDFIIINAVVTGEHIAASLPINQQKPRKIIASITISKGTGFIPIPEDNKVNMLIELGTYYTTNNRWIDPLHNDRFYTYGKDGLYEISDIYHYMYTQENVSTSDIIIITILILILIVILTAFMTIIFMGFKKKGLSEFNF